MQNVNTNNDAATVGELSWVQFPPPAEMVNTKRSKSNRGMRRLPTVEIPDADFIKVNNLLQNDFGQVPYGAFAKLIRSLVGEYLRQHEKRNGGSEPQLVDPFEIEVMTGEK